MEDELINKRQNAIIQPLLTGISLIKPIIHYILFTYSWNELKSFPNKALNSSLEGLCLPDDLFISSFCFDVCISLSDRIRNVRQLLITNSCSRFVPAHDGVCLLEVW